MIPITIHLGKRTEGEQKAYAEGYKAGKEHAILHGEWKGKFFCSNYSGYDYGMNCSVCGKPTHRQLAEKMPPYCPNCGARMVNEDE